MNETQIEYRKADGFKEEMPSEVGLWQIVCGENANIACHVAITKSKGVLWVHDPDIGIYDLKSYHNGLTHPMWKKLM